MNRHEIQIKPSLCIGCDQCAKDCPTSNIQLKDKKAEILEAECIMCGHCAAICPKKAVTISGYSEAAVEQASSVRLDPQKVLEVIRFRRTIRQFQETEIPAEVISQILEAGRLTHTAENKQDVTYIVIDKEKASLEQQAVKFFRRLKPVANLFSSMARRTVIDDHFFFFQAPVAIVIAAKEEINGALAAEYGICCGGKRLGGTVQRILHHGGEPFAKLAGGIAHTKRKKSGHNAVSGVS